MNKEKEFLCPACGRPMMTAWDQTEDLEHSGIREIVCHCRNDECGLDWKVDFTEEYNHIEYNRYFFG